MRKFLFVVYLMILCLFLPNLITAQSITSYQSKLEKGWLFLKGDIGGIWETLRIPQIGQPTSLPLWNEVAVPHCFNSTDAVHPDVNYYQGPGWYRTTIDVKNPYANGTTMLYFEGVGQKTDVYVGFEKVGSHIGGYDEWYIDITEAIKITQNQPFFYKNYGEKIPISIRCDNSRDVEMIPSDLSDFHIYGGLYRHVHLQYFPTEWFNRLKIDAMADKSGKMGTVNVELFPANKFTENPEIEIVVHDKSGKEIVRKKVENNTFKTSFTIKKPELWSPSSPLLYTVTTTANFNGQKQTLSDRFGFRHFEFKENGPFFLNGKQLLLKGTHRHDDYAGVAAAQSDEQIRAEMKLIKEMGANFIRLGHYQQSKLVLDMCDSLGLLVWEEIPWCRGGLGGATYREQAIRMLENMITQHYNHPSVILWGLGNENDWPGDFEHFDQDSIVDFMQQLHDLSHKLDSGRLTAIRRCEFCKHVVDVYSPSIWAGWYRGRYIDYKRVSEYEIGRVKHFFHAEWGADSHVGRHTEDLESQWQNIASEMLADERDGDASLYGGQKRMSKDGDWSESYAVELYDWTLKEQLSMPELTGTAFWVFKDFATPIRPENPIPYMNQKGVVQRDLTPKEVFYVVQSYWAETPMVHIYGHSWPVRWGETGALSQVKVYSNCDKVELIVNGKSMGLKQRNSGEFPAAGLYWNVPLNEGVNEVVAIGLSGQKVIEDQLTWQYQTGGWGDIDQLKIEEELIDQSTSYIKATAVDRNGKICLDANMMVEFGVTGQAELSENQGTATGSRKIQLANGMAKIKLFKTGDKYSVSVQAPQVGCNLLNR